MMNGPRSARVAALMLAFPVLCSGCSSRGYVPAHGQVVIDGKPAVGLTLLFMPAEDAKADKPRPTGKVDKDGRFSLTTVDPATRTIHTGAPPGRYVVVLTRSQGSKAKSEDGSDLSGWLDPVYRDVSTSPLKADVKAGAAELPLISLPASAFQPGRPRIR